MRRKLAPRPDIAEAIIPKDFAVGCRRPTPGNGYLEALCEDNVEVVLDGIAEITPTGVKTVDGQEHQVDIIVCATGFDVSWKPAYPTIGRGNRSLSKEWETIPRTYLSVTVPHFPNYLSEFPPNFAYQVQRVTGNEVFNGPFGPYAHGSFLPITETTSKHFIQMIEKMAYEHVTSFEPKLEAVEDFEEHRRTFIPRTAWSSPCRSWFKQGTIDGEVMMWPGSRIHFFENMQRPRWEDYELKHANKNRFHYFGNGFSAREFDGRDLSWYLGLLNGKDEQVVFRKEDIAALLDV